MILNASATNGTIAASKPTEECEEFFKCKSVGQAKLLLLEMVKNEFNCNVAVSSGVIMALQNGQFTYKFEDSPSNFSIFNFPRPSLDRSDAERECLKLTLKQLDGGGLSKDDIASAINQKFNPTNQVDVMKAALCNFKGVSEIFFGSESNLPPCIQNVIDNIDDNFMSYQSLQAGRQTFCTEFMYAIDLEVQEWLQQCKSSIERESVDDDLLDFRQRFKEVRGHRFEVQLPAFMLDEFEDDSDKHTEKKRRGNDKKKMNNNNDKKNNNTNAGSIVINDNPIADWHIPENIAESKFKGNKILKLRPKLKGRPMCHRFHSTSQCFDNCNNICTHIPSDEVPPETASKYRNWVHTNK